MSSVVEAQIGPGYSPSPLQGLLSGGAEKRTRSNRKSSAPAKSGRHLAKIYLLFGIGWVLFGDLLLVTFQVQDSPQLQTFKGWLFVVLSAALIYKLTSRYEAESQRLQGKLREQRSRLRKILESVSDGIALVDENSTVLDVSDSGLRLLGVSLEETLGRSTLDFIHPDDHHRALTALAEARSHRAGTELVEVRFSNGRDEWRYLEGMAVHPGGNLDATILTWRDVTERKAAAQRFRYLAHHDATTDLPNRSLFLERLEHSLEGSARRSELVAVMFLDLDRFKVVNDTLGHSLGDELLIQVGQRLKGCLREEDTVARLGGDEFGVLLERVESVKSAEAAAQRLVEAFREPFFLREQRIDLGASIGVAFSRPGETTRSKDLLRFSDIAMYRAKLRAQSCYQVFDSSIDGRSARRFHVETDLRKAIEDGELELHYQPIVELATGRIGWAEALLRWRYRTSELISIAEESGLIVPLGRWVIETACRDLGSLRRLESPHRLSFVSVNLSPCQIDDPHLTKTVLDGLEAHGLEPGDLQLEVTETALAQIDGRLSALKSLGVRLALDDFGTGYSSLRNLREFPIDTLKIDASFVQEIELQPRNAAIIEAILQLGYKLHLAVVAEGVETEPTLLRLQELGCQWIQGFIYSKALSSQDFGALLQGSKIRQLSPPPPVPKLTLEHRT